MSKKILVITEGNEEERLFNAIADSIEFLFRDEYEIVKLNNPIYELYDLVRNDEYFDMVRYLEKKNNKNYDDYYFSQVYLVFDFDPQYQKYSDEKIKEMQKLFDNETINGKMYINYPMLESAYHLKSKYDEEFSNSKIELDKISSEFYKKLVNSESYIKKSGLSEDVVKNMIKQHYLKIVRIMGIKFGEDIDYCGLLEKQIEIKNKEKAFYIISTLLMMVYDHNPEETLKLINIKNYNHQAQ